MANRAIHVTRLCLIVRRLRSSVLGIRQLTVAFHAKLPHRTAIQHLRIAGSMRLVASSAAFCFKRSVLEYEWALFVVVTLDASDISADRKLGLLPFEAAMRIVAIAALHCAFKYLVVERFGELCSGFLVAAHAKLLFVGLELER